MFVSRASHLRRHPPAPLAIGLDLTVAAHQIVVRGRGMFAELAGSLKVGGSTAAPQPLGSFHMVRGNLSIAGQTLNIREGRGRFQRRQPDRSEPQFCRHQ